MSSAGQGASPAAKCVDMWEKVRYTLSSLKFKHALLIIIMVDLENASLFLTVCHIILLLSSFFCLKSPGHLANILRNSGLVVTGVSFTSSGAFYCTQTFATGSASGGGSCASIPNGAPTVNDAPASARGSELGPAGARSAAPAPPPARVPAPAPEPVKKRKSQMEQPFNGYTAAEVMCMQKCAN